MVLPDNTGCVICVGGEEVPLTTSEFCCMLPHLLTLPTLPVHVL